MGEESWVVVGRRDEGVWLFGGYFLCGETDGSRWSRETEKFSKFRSWLGGEMKGFGCWEAFLFGEMEGVSGPSGGS